MSFDRFTGIVNCEIITGKLSYADWQTWKREEVQAIHNFFLALWRHQLSEFPYGYNDPYFNSAPSEEWLCIIAQAETDLSAFLQAWLEMPLIPSMLHLAQFINNTSFGSGSVSNANIDGFWNGQLKKIIQIITWLSQPNLVLRLESILFEDIEANYADTLALAIDRLARFQHDLPKPLPDTLPKV